MQTQERKSIHSPVCAVTSTRPSHSPSLSFRIPSSDGGCLSVILCTIHRRTKMSYCSRFAQTYFRRTTPREETQKHRLGNAKPVLLTANYAGPKKLIYQRRSDNAGNGRGLLGNGLNILLDESAAHKAGLALSVFDYCPAILEAEDGDLRAVLRVSTDL